MMEVAKVFLYCTMAKPYLIDTKLPFQKWELHDKKYEVCKEHYVNGKVCFECDCKESLILEPSYHDDSFYPNHRDFDYEVIEDSIFKRMGFEENDDCYEFLNNYAKGKDLYAYHFENVRPINPMPITQLYRDGTMVYPLTRAPQSYCFAYRKVETTKEDYLSNVGKDESRYYIQQNGKFFYSEKVLVFSIRSPWLCKIANGEKDLEVRKTRILNAGIEYK